MKQMTRVRKERQYVVISNERRHKPKLTLSSATEIIVRERARTRCYKGSESVGGNEMSNGAILRTSPDTSYRTSRETRGQWFV